MREFFIRIVYLFLIVLSFLSFVTAVIYIAPRYTEWKHRGEQEVALMQDVETLQQAIADVKRSRARFQTSPQFVEQLARKNRRIAENEIVFIFE